MGQSNPPPHNSGIQRTKSIQVIHETLNTLIEPGSVVELRTPSTRRGTVSGYFDDLDALARIAADRNGTASGLYLTLNPVNPSLLARAKNRVVNYADNTTGVDDIINHRWVLVDIDPVRPSGISITNEEYQFALTKAQEVVKCLLSLGFCQSFAVLADSRNDARVFIRADLPNDPQITHLVQRRLQALDLRFSDKSNHVNITTNNASRLCKVYGISAGKGDSTPECPHRLYLLSWGSTRRVNGGVRGKLSARNALAKRSGTPTLGETISTRRRWFKD